MNNPTNPHTEEITHEYETEEWILGGCSGRMITTEAGYCGDGFIADVDTEANAKRIVTCVNAFAGIPNPAEFMKKLKWMFEESFDETCCTCGADDWPSTADGGKESNCYYHELMEMAPDLFPADKGGE